MLKLLSNFFKKEETKQVQAILIPAPQVKEQVKNFTKQGLKEELKSFAYNKIKSRPLWIEFNAKWKDNYDWVARKPDYDKITALYPVPSQREARHKHIAYSMMRGRKYEQIEQKTRPDNKADMKYVEQIIAEYSKGT